MANSRLVIGSGVIEAALRQKQGVEIRALELRPPAEAHIVAQTTVPFLGRDIVVQPEAQIFVRVADGSIALQVTGLSVFGLPLPPAMLEQALREYTQGPEQEANEAIRKVVSLTGLHLQTAYFTTDSLVLEFG